MKASFWQEPLNCWPRSPTTLLFLIFRSCASHRLQPQGSEGHLWCFTNRKVELDELDNKENPPSTQSQQFSFFLFFKIPYQQDFKSRHSCQDDQHTCVGLWTWVMFEFFRTSLCLRKQHVYLLGPIIQPCTQVCNLASCHVIIVELFWSHVIIKNVSVFISSSTNGEQQEALLTAPCEWLVIHCLAQ